MALVSAHTLASDGAVFAAAQGLLDAYMSGTPDVRKLGDVSPAMGQLVFKAAGRPDLCLTQGEPVLRCHLLPRSFGCPHAGLCADVPVLVVPVLTVGSKRQVHVMRPGHRPSPLAQRQLRKPEEYVLRVWAPNKWFWSGQAGRPRYFVLREVRVHSSPGPDGPAYTLQFEPVAHRIFEVRVGASTALDDPLPAGRFDTQAALEHWENTKRANEEYYSPLRAAMRWVRPPRFTCAEDEQEFERIHRGLQTVLDVRRSRDPAFYDRMRRYAGLEPKPGEPGYEPDLGSEGDECEGQEEQPTMADLDFIDDS